MGVSLEGGKRGCFLWTGSHLFFKMLSFHVALLKIDGLIHNSGWFYILAG